MVFRLLNRALHFPGFRASCSNVDCCGPDFVVLRLPGGPASRPSRVNSNEEARQKCRASTRSFNLKVEINARRFYRGSTRFRSNPSSRCPCCLHQTCR